MLDPKEKDVFDGMIVRLGEDDPDFLRKVDRIVRPRQRLRTTMAILLWVAAPLCILFGGGTGLILAILAFAYGAHFMSIRNREAGGPGWWPFPPRRPRSTFF